MVLPEKEKSGQQRLSRKHMWRISVSRGESRRKEPKMEQEVEAEVEAEVEGEPRSERE
jgi:hypothetical protein